MKSFRLIQRVATHRTLAKQLLLAKKLKFEFILLKMVNSVQSVIFRQYRHAFSFVSMILAVPTHGNSRLNQIKRLKGKIIVEGLRIQGGLSKSQSSKEKCRSNNSRVDFKIFKPKSSIRKYGSFLFDKENETSKKTLEDENRFLEIKINQTEKMFYKLIDDSTREITALAKNNGMGE